jgi:phosphoribosylglycinamide formyltransferase 1
MNSIAIFASGCGSNAQAITEYLRSKELDAVKLILSNKPDAYVLERAKQLNIPSIVFDRNQLYNSSEVADVLERHHINLIILAGFLWLIPDYLLKKYKNRIVNIHPALLPKYGGKGMYGMKVHETVVANKEKESGISIHYCNEEYDRGEIIFQAKCTVEPSDTPEMVAQKIHQLEYEHYPKVIEMILKKSCDNKF